MLACGCLRWSVDPSTVAFTGQDVQQIAWSNNLMGSQVHPGSSPGGGAQTRRRQPAGRHEMWRPAGVLSRVSVKAPESTQCTIAGASMSVSVTGSLPLRITVAEMMPPRANTAAATQKATV